MKAMGIVSVGAILTISLLLANMQLVSADNDVDGDAVFAVTLPGFNILGTPADHNYTDIATSQPDTVLYTNPASLPGGYFDAVDPTFQGGGAAPATDANIILYFGGAQVSPILNVSKGFQEGNFTFNVLPDTFYFVNVTISDLDNFGLTLDADQNIPAVETVFITANVNASSFEIGSISANSTIVQNPPSDPGQTVADRLPLIAKSNSTGDLRVGFNQLFVWDDTQAAPEPGSQSGIRVERIILEERSGVLNKLLNTTTYDCTEVDIKNLTSTICQFDITYSGDSALIKDTVPAEWNVTSIDNRGGDSCSWDATGANKKSNGKSATKLECDATNGDVDSTVTIETRESPDTKKHPGKDKKHKPTSCGDLYVNSGAIALLTENGEVVLTGELTPAVLDETDPIIIQAVGSLTFECED